MPEKQILTHVCCGPCSTYVTTQLKAEGFSVTGYYFNPNIYPPEEYAKRREVAQEYFKDEGMVFIEGEYDTQKYYSCLGGVTEIGKRCRECYWLRLSETALKASEMRIPFFTTTLLISPYQNQAVLREIGKRLADKYNLVFYEEDFTKGYQESRKIARERDMYRQKYCGCEYSLRESAEKKAASL